MTAELTEYEVLEEDFQVAYDVAQEYISELLSEGLLQADAETIAAMVSDAEDLVLQGIQHGRAAASGDRDDARDGDDGGKEEGGLEATSEGPQETATEATHADCI